MININPALINVLSNPKTKIPDELAEYLFNNKSKWTFRTLLLNFNKPIMVEFAIGEAKLVLPMFETMFPGDSRPRDAILAASLWLSDHDVTAAADAATAATAAAYAAYTDAATAAAAYNAADAAYNATDAAAYAAYNATDAAAYAAYTDAARSAYNAADAARSANNAAAARAAYAATDAAARAAAADARAADPSITLEDQIERLFQLALNERNSINTIVTTVNF